MQLQNIKKIITILIAVIFCHQSLFCQSPITQPAGLETYTIKKEGVTDPVQAMYLTSNADRVRTIKYVDGLGRPIQSIVAAGSPNGKDMVSFDKYDQYGREVKYYLPFEATTNSGAYNSMTTITADQLNFYSPSTSAVKKIAGDNYPFSESSFESSPLSRVSTAGGIGDGFQLGQHSKTINLLNNTISGNNAVLKWTLGSGVATSSGSSFYPANELTVSEMVDENGFSSKVFRDKFGRLILKRQTGNLDTYYIYDNIGNIVYIIPPKAIAKLALAGGTYTTSAVSDLIFQFWHDNKNRIFRKKVPGAAEVYMIYDPLGRIVLTQDGKMRNSSKWTYVKYDNANRVIIQGVYTNTSIATTAMQDYVNNSVLVPCYTNGNHFEIRQSTISGYSNQCFPITGTEERIYNYFDNYDFDYDGNPDYAKLDQGLTNEAAATDLTYGMPTGSKKKIIGSGTPGTWLVTVNFYDKYYHLIQMRSNNQIRTTLTDHTTNVVNFAGKATEVKKAITINDPYGITGTLEITVGNRYEYDDMGRLIKVKQTNPGQSEIIVAKYEYNALGQLVDKKLHSTNNGLNYLQSVDMRYNIRGQLLSINNSARNINTNNNDESNDVFGMEILYEKEETGTNEINNTGNITGMISAIKWSAGGTGSPVNSALKSYKYTYDNQCRLTGSQYQEKNVSGIWNKNLNGFNESISYDQNGNITSLQRNALISGTVTQIDALTYSYKNNDLSNQLLKIDDGININATGYGYQNFAGANTNDPYIYDDNGNLTNDPKKGTSITYNELNKPEVIQMGSKSKIEFRYDAHGIRISKYIYNNSSTPTKQIEYVGGYVIENGVLSYYRMAEGRARNEGGGYGLSIKMEYFITDHQGNTRVSFEDDGTNTNHAVISQENSYYAFGMQMAGSYMPTNANKKLYNAGSEWQDDIDGLADYYSTFYREYDPIIGRFNSVDPMSTITDNMTTYAYANNNPIMLNDAYGTTARGNDPPPRGWFDGGYGLLPILDDIDDIGEWDFTAGDNYLQQAYNIWHNERYGNGFNLEKGISPQMQNLLNRKTHSTISIQQVTRNGESLTKLTLASQTWMANNWNFAYDSPHDFDYWEEDMYVLEVFVNGTGNIVGSELTFKHEDHLPNLVNEDLPGQVIESRKEVMVAATAIRKGKNSFIFTSEKNQIISNDTRFAQILEGTMKYNKEEPLDFPTGLAQDYLDKTDFALSIAGLLPLGTMANIALTTISIGFPDAKEIGALEQILYEQEWFQYEGTYGITPIQYSQSSFAPYYHPFDW